MIMTAETLLNELRNRGFEIYMDDYKSGDRTQRGIRVNPPDGRVSEFALQEVEKYKKDLICILNREQELRILVLAVCRKEKITNREEQDRLIYNALDRINEALPYYATKAFDYNIYDGGPWE